MNLKKNFIHLLALLFLVVLLPGCDGPAEEAGEQVDEAVQMHKEKLEKSQKEIADAKAQIEDLKQELAAARQERDQAKTKLEESERERQRILQEIEKSGMIKKDDAGSGEQQKKNDAVPEEQKNMQQQSMDADEGSPPDQPAGDEAEKPSDSEKSATKQQELMPQET